MTYIKKINALADKFERKLAQIQTAEQPSTTTLFFGEGSDQQKFANMVQDPQGPVGKFLTDVAMKTQRSTSFDLKISAEPHKGASWVLTVAPTSLRGAVMKLMDSEFQKLRKATMGSQAAMADKGAKAGGGTGTNQVASLNIDM